jgi:5-methylcytosine-specific restriction endonuclease McrA
MTRQEKNDIKRNAKRAIRRQEEAVAAVVSREFAPARSNYTGVISAYIADQQAYKTYLWSLPTNKRYLLERDAAGSYTLQEWKDLCAKYDHRCLKCGRTDRPLSVDHIIPLSCGGSHRIENLQPLCRNCNSSKGTKRTDYRPKD